MHDDGPQNFQSLLRILNPLRLSDMEHRGDSTILVALYIHRSRSVLLYRLARVNALPPEHYRQGWRIPIAELLEGLAVTVFYTHAGEPDLYTTVADIRDGTLYPGFSSEENEGALCLVGLAVAQYFDEEMPERCANDIVRAMGTFSELPPAPLVDIRDLEALLDQSA